MSSQSEQQVKTRRPSRVLAFGIYAGCIAWWLGMGYAMPFPLSWRFLGIPHDLLSLIGLGHIYYACVGSLWIFAIDVVFTATLFLPMLLYCFYKKRWLIAIQIVAILSIVGALVAALEMMSPAAK